jgi:hypothetical protein
MTDQRNHEALEEFKSLRGTNTESLFVSSKDILDRIITSLNQNGIGQQSKIINSFEYNNVKYDLDEDMCKSIMAIIGEISTPQDKKNIVNNQYSTNAFLEKITEMMLQIQEQPQKWRPIIRGYLHIIDKTNYKQLARIINDLVSYHLMEYLWTKSFKEEVSFCFTTMSELSFHLGIACLKWWFLHIIEEGLYKHENERYKMFQLNYEIKENEEFKDIIDLFQKLHNKYVEFKRDAKLEGRKPSVENFLENMDTNPDEDQITDYEKIAVTIGAFFVDQLTIFNLLREVPREEFTSKRSTVLALAQEYEQNLIRATSYYKPSLLSNYKRPVNIIEDKETRSAFIVRDSSNASGNKKFTYTYSDILSECVETNEVTYCINTPFLGYYMEYFNYIYSLDWNVIITDPSSKQSTEIEHFLYITYNFNISDLRHTFKTNEILALLNYIKDKKVFNTKYARQLRRQLSANHKILKQYLLSQEKQGKLTFKDFIEDPVLDSKYEEYAMNCEKSSKLLTFYSKISAQKYFIINFLADAFIYKHFKHFFLERKVTSIGRLQTLPHFISLQTNKFSRAFIIYKVNNNFQINEYNFKYYRKIFRKTLKYVSPKLKELTYTQFQELLTKNHEEYILSYFSKNVTINDLMSLDFQNLNGILEKLINEKAFKKTQTALLGLSILYYKKNLCLYEGKEPFVFLDSTMSGTQHMANLFRHKTAARNGSLIGSVKYDLNLIFLKELKECLSQKVPTIANNFLKKIGFADNEILTLTLENVLYNINEKLVLLNYDIDIKALNEAVKGHTLTTKLDLYFKEISKYDLELLNANLDVNSDTNIIFETVPTYEINKHANIKDINQILCLFTKSHFPSIFNAKQKVKKNENIIKNILIVLLRYTLKTIENAYPQFYNLLDHRDVIKQRIMATAYGMTTFGGLQTIRHHLTNAAIENGMITMSKIYINVVAELTSNYFEHKFSAEHLDYVNNFLKLGSFLNFRSEAELHFETEYLTWTYRPKIFKQMRYNVARWNAKNNNFKTLNRRSISIMYKTNEIDRKKVQSSFAPLIIQSIEANLMINWLVSSSKINRLLQDKLQIPYFYSPNYDCFGVNFRHAALLRLHLEHCYHETYRMNFRKSLEDIFHSLPTDEKEELTNKYLTHLIQKPGTLLFWDGIITNPYFVTA